MKEPLIKTKKDKEQVIKWLAALRSGKYKQSKEVLQSIDGYCCLGVACKVLIPKSKMTFNGKSGLMSGSMPVTQEFAPDWLVQINGYLPTRLTNLNDIDNYTFSQIADYVEKELKEEMDLIKLDKISFLKRLNPFK